MNARARRTLDRLRRLPRRARVVVARLARRWRSSMQAQVITTTLVVGTITMVALGGYLTTSIRDGLFTERVDQILLESARSTSEAQRNFDAATASTSTQVQQLLNDILTRLSTGGAAQREAFLWRPEGSTSLVPVIDLNTAPSLAEVITPDMRARTVAASDQLWQSVGVAQPDGTVVPGIVVGSMVEVPLAGPFELYYLYTLEQEQRTLAFIQRILLGGAFTLVGLILAITWLVTRQAVHPVRQAAGVAARLADGHLDERMVVRGQDEMATLAASFNEMAASLQDQIEQMESLSTLQRRFVSDVSHELRTPLTTIRMAAEVIHAARDEFEPAIRRSAELLGLQLDRFEDLLADLLEISRFDAGAATLEAERRDLRDVADRALDQAMVLAQTKGVWITASYPDEPVIADLDPRRVERILRNLLVNAVEHAEDGPVELTVGASAHSVAVTVRDYGVGMSREATAHVFDRFWRADPARARTSGGTGLGLAISLEDAHLHGGWLEAWGSPGTGACFRLTVPRRAGIVLESSPLPLAPERTYAGPAVTTGSIPVVRVADHGPAAVPTLDDDSHSILVAHDRPQEGSR